MWIITTGLVVYIMELKQLRLEKNLAPVHRGARLQPPFRPDTDQLSSQPSFCPLVLFLDNASVTVLLRYLLVKLASQSLANA